MTDEQIQRLARSIRFISHGEEEPAGLEAVAMALSKKDDDSVSGAIWLLADAIDDVASAINRIADAMESNNGN